MGNLIVMYNGNTNNIPAGWYLCDGKNETPNLVGKFIKGTSEFGDIGGNGGTLQHNHYIEISPSHDHSTGSAGAHFHDGNGSYNTTPKGLSHSADNYHRTDELSHTHNSTGSVSGHSHTSSNASTLPKYYTLCYIMAKADIEFDFKVGSIVMYAGLKDDIPNGWAMCNGDNGTINLQNRFIKGGTTKGTSGGASSHTHNASLAPSHSHSMTSTNFEHQHWRGVEVYSGFYADNGSRDATTYGGASHKHSLDSAGSHTHVIGEVSNDPPYYKLAFIQKIA